MSFKFRKKKYENEESSVLENGYSFKIREDSDYAIDIEDMYTEEEWEEHYKWLEAEKEKTKAEEKRKAEEMKQKTEKFNKNSAEVSIRGKVFGKYDMKYSYKYFLWSGHPYSLLINHNKEYSTKGTQYYVADDAMKIITREWLNNCYVDRDNECALPNHSTNKQSVTKVIFENVKEGLINNTYQGQYLEEVDEKKIHFKTTTPKIQYLTAAVASIISAVVRSIMFFMKIATKGCVIIWIMTTLWTGFRNLLKGDGYYNYLVNDSFWYTFGIGILLAIVFYWTTFVGDFTSSYKIKDFPTIISDKLWGEKEKRMKKNMHLLRNDRIYKKEKCRIKKF